MPAQVCSCTTRAQRVHKFLRPAEYHVPSFIFFITSKITE